MRQSGSTSQATEIARGINNFTNVCNAHCVSWMQNRCNPDLKMSFLSISTKNWIFLFEARDKTSSIHMIRIILFDISRSCLVLMIFSSLSPTDSWRNRNYEVRVRSIHVYFCYNHSEQSKCTLDKSPAATRSSFSPAAVVDDDHLHPRSNERELMPRAMTRSERSERSPRRTPDDDQRNDKRST